MRRARHLQWWLAVLRSASLSSLLVVALGVFTVRDARAEGERLSQCVSFTLGYGKSAFSGGLRVLDEKAHGAGSLGFQFAHCGEHLDLGGALHFAGVGGLGELLTASARLHTESPMGSGIEAGVGARLGVAHLYLPSGYTDDYSYWHAWGPIAVVGPDVRWWLGDTFGLSAGLDLLVGTVSGSEGGREYTERFIVYQGTLGTVHRF